MLLYPSGRGALSSRAGWNDGVAHRLVRQEDPMSDPHPDSPPDEQDLHPDSPELKRKAATSDSHRLDEGLEETFPASDPVSAKHIT